MYRNVYGLIFQNVLTRLIFLPIHPQFLQKLPTAILQPMSSSTFFYMFINPWLYNIVFGSSEQECDIVNKFMFALVVLINRLEYFQEHLLNFWYHGLIEKSPSVEHCAVITFLEKFLLRKIDEPIWPKSGRCLFCKEKETYVSQSTVAVLQSSRYQSTSSTSLNAYRNPS